MDLYDSQRHLVKAGSVARQNKNEWGGGSGWSNVYIVILDNYCEWSTTSAPVRVYLSVDTVLITSEETQNGVTLCILISRVGIYTY